MRQIGSPHDRYFRENFRRVEIARDFLHHHLPAELLAIVDLDSLKVSPDSFIAEDLSEHYSDLVYQLTLGEAPMSIYLLFEHKSHPEHWTLLQVLRYVVAAGDQHRKQQPKARKLPPVYPLVLYHGKAAWKAPLRFHDLIDPLPDPLKPHVPDFRCPLHDISERAGAEIKGSVQTRLALLALRYIFTEQPRERLRELLDLITQIGDQSEATRILYTLLRYFAQANPALDRREIQTIVQQLPIGDTIMPTLAEQWVQEGEAKALLRQIEIKFGPLNEDIRQRVEQADPKTVEAWLERILSAETLEAILH